jgi:hypothetical protein
MKVSIFGADKIPRACPLCMTMVRSGTRALAGPSPGPVVFVETDWLYHVTDVAIARLMKISGIQSAFLRTGRRAPDENGSFFLDKVKRIDNKREERLKYYACICLLNGWPPAADRPYRPLVHFPTGSNNDYEPLEKQQDEALRIFGNVEEFSIKKLSTVKAQAAQIATELSHRRDLYLWKLADQYAECYFNVEGAITSSHIYFLNTKQDRESIMVGFRDYIKFRSPSSVAVLRVRRADVLGLEQDMADHRAVRTQRSVSADKLQILIGIHTDFLRDNLRGADESWMPLASWS